MNTATPQETYDHTIGAGALTWDWWLACTTTGVSESGDVADDWQATLTAEDNPAPVIIGHAEIIAAARKIIADASIPPKSALGRACRALIFDHDDADFDADTGDALLQMAVMGEVIFA